VPSFLPSPHQSLLLGAALSDGPTAVRAWERWRHATDVDALDPESGRLLPLLVWNLRRSGVDHATLVRYHSVHKKTWYRNQLSFRALTSLLRLLRQANVETLVLKGVVLALHYYPQVGLRPMNDVDVLVRSGQLESALRVLRATGWAPVTLPNGREFSSGATGFYHSWGFRNGTTSELDLHWHASADSCQWDADESSWDASVPFAVGTEATRTLNATDLLLSILVHAYASHAPVIRWVADAAMIMRAAGDDVDWDRFADQAARRRLVVPVRVALRYLDDSGFVPIPIPTIRRFEATRTGWMDRAEYAHRQSARPYSLPNKIARLWFWNWRLRGHAPSLSAAISFPGFLRRYAAH